MLRSSTSRTPTWLFGYRFHLTRRSRPQPAPTNISIENQHHVADVHDASESRALLPLLHLGSTRPITGRRSSECDPRLHADTARRPNPCDGPWCNHAHCASEHHLIRCYASSANIPYTTVRLFVCFYLENGSG